MHGLGAEWALRIRRSHPDAMAMAMLMLVSDLDWLSIGGGGLRARGTFEAGFPPGTRHMRQGAEEAGGMCMGPERRDSREAREGRDTLPRDTAHRSGSRDTQRPPARRALQGDTLL